MGRAIVFVGTALLALICTSVDLYAQGNINRGRQLAEEHQCASCHSVESPSTANAPYIDGQKIYYLSKQLTLLRDSGPSVPNSPLRSNQRRHPTMKWLSDGLSDTNIRDLAEYFASLPCTPVRRVPRMTKEAPDKGQRCAYCHGVTGVSSYDILPNLGGQKKQYLIDELVTFRASALDKPLGADYDRSSIMMAPASYDLSDNEIIEFANYYSRQSCKLSR